MALPTSDAVGTACIANISLQERRRRLGFGLVTLLLGLCALAALMVGGADRWWRLPLFLLYYPAAIGYFQWRDHTCVALAVRSERKLGDRAERIQDPEELAQVRAQARRVQVKALTTGVLITLIALIVP